MMIMMMMMIYLFNLDVGLLRFVSPLTDTLQLNSRCRRCFLSLLRSSASPIRCI